jgi:hypothetical protein
MRSPCCVCAPPYFFVFYYVRLTSKESGRLALNRTSCNIIFPPPSGLFPSDFSTNTCIHFSSPNACYTPRPSHRPWLHHSTGNYIWRRVQFMKLLVIQFSVMVSSFRKCDECHTVTPARILRQATGDSLSPSAFTNTVNIYLHSCRTCRVGRSKIMRKQ